MCILLGKIKNFLIFINFFFSFFFQVVLLLLAIFYIVHKYVLLYSVTVFLFFFHRKQYCFFSFFFTKTYIVGSHEKHIVEGLQGASHEYHNICFCEEIRIIFIRAQLFKTNDVVS